MFRPVSLLPLLLVAGAAFAAAPAWNDFPWRPADPHRDLAMLGSTESWYRTWVEDRLSVGLSFYTYRFLKNDRHGRVENEGTFVGFITHLGEEDSLEVAPTVTYRFTPYVRMGFSYESYSASTRNFNTGVGDGSIEMSGPLFSVEGAYPMFWGELVPHAGLGIALLSSDFQTDRWWGLDYPTEEDWKAVGSPSNKTYGRRHRMIRIDDETAFFAQLGATWSPHPRFELDFTMRYMRIDPDCAFGYLYNNGKWVARHHGDFDLTNLTFLLTASWVF